MPADKHLVLDVSAIIDLWLNHAPVEHPLAELLDAAPAAGVQLWVAATQLATLEYVTRRRLKTLDVAPETACKTAYRLVQQLLSRVKVLSSFGYEQQALQKAARDLEDAQIAASARCLRGASVAIVTLDREFDTLGEWETLNPQAALEWLRSPGSGANAPIAFIDLAAQQRHLRPQLERSIHTVLHHGQYIMGPEIPKLEQQLAAFTGAPHCITCASGTDALLMALMALKIGPGDEVITVPYTWISTAEVIALINAKPVFVDIQADTFNLDPQQLEAAITPRTKAIMPVGIYGQCADLTRINAIADKHGIPVIEDAAQCFGATHHGRQSGNLSLMGCTSFFPSKPLGCYGDGGAIFTSDANLAETLRQIRIHGQKVKHQHPLVGINGRLDTLQAAILLEKFSLFPQECAQRAAVGQRYDELLADLPEIVTPVIAPGNTSVYAQYTILAKDRDALSRKLKEQGIPAVAYYTGPLHLQGAFAQLGYQPGDFPVAEQVASECLSLPMSAYLAPEDQERVVEAIC